MAAYVELYIDQGTTYTNTITLADDLTNVSINLENYSVKSQMRRSFIAANASAEFTCTIQDSANGVILMSLDSGTTSNLKPGKYVFDLQTTTPGGVVTRVIEGLVIITPSATK